MRYIPRPLRRVFWLGTAVLALTVAAVLYLSDANLRAHGGGRGLEVPVDVVLVLGGGHDGDGLISYSSRRRARAAVALLEAGLAQRLIFSGSSRPGTSVPAEAVLMRDFALGLGAPPDRLLVEPEAGNTFENLRFGFALAQALGAGRVAILTDAFHLERARRLAAYLGHPDAGLVAVDGLRHAGPGDRVWSILREALAWWYNLARIAGSEVLGGADRPEATR